MVDKITFDPCQLCSLPSPPSTDSSCNLLLYLPGANRVAGVTVFPTTWVPKSLGPSHGTKFFICLCLELRNRSQVR